MFPQFSISSIDCYVILPKKILNHVLGDFFITAFDAPKFNGQRRSKERRERLWKIMNVKKGLEAIKKLTRVLHVQYKNSLKRSLLIRLLSCFLFTILYDWNFLCATLTKGQGHWTFSCVCFCFFRLKIFSRRFFSGPSRELGISSIKNRNILRSPAITKRWN